MARSNDAGGILLVGGGLFLVVGVVWRLVTGESWQFAGILGALFLAVLIAKAATTPKR